MFAGIHPICGHEVGRATDLVTLGSNYKCPQAAIVQSKLINYVNGLWAHSKNFGKLNLINKPLRIAFPNDRPQSIRPTWEAKEYM